MDYTWTHPKDTCYTANCLGILHWPQNSVKCFIHITTIKIKMKKKKQFKVALWTITSMVKTIDNYLHDASQVIPRNVIIWIQSDCCSQRHLSESRTSQNQMNLTQRLETLKVTRIDWESILITGFGLFVLVPGLVDGPLQVEDQVGQGEDLQ